MGTMEPTNGDGGSMDRTERSDSGPWMMDNGMVVWPIWHRVCGGVVFYSRVPVTWATPMRSADVVLLDGSIPNYGAAVQCRTCGSRIMDWTEIAPVPGFPSG